MADTFEADAFNVLQYPNGPRLRKGIFTEAMRVRVAIKGDAEAYGASSIASGKEVAARADNLLSFDQMVSIMHRSYAADQAIHSDPLRCLQTGVEVRITYIRTYIYVYIYKYIAVLYVYIMYIHIIYIIERESYSIYYI